MSDEKSWAELAIEQIEIGYKRIELLEAERDEWKDVAERRQLEIERMSIYKNKLLHASESTLTPHKIFTSDRIVSVADALANYPNGLMTLEESRESTQAPHKVKPEHPIEPGYNYHYAGEKIQSGWECLQNDGKEWALTDFAGHTIGETGTGTVYRSKKPVLNDKIKIGIAEIIAMREGMTKTRQAIEEIIRLCNRHAQPGVNTATHELASKILVILEEREAGK